MTQGPHLPAATADAERRSASSLVGDVTLVLPEFDAPPTDPIALLTQWLAGAEAHGVREPYAFSLGTADARGRPSSRVVLLKGIEAGGLLFGASCASRKGRDISENPFASAGFHWRETVQQVIAAGSVGPLSGERADALFAARPRGAQVAATLSAQSDTLGDEAELRRRAASLVASDAPLERPATWFAYLLVPDRIEFWHGQPDRLHRRLEYTRAGEGWTALRLQP